VTALSRTNVYACLCFRCAHCHQTCLLSPTAFAFGADILMDYEGAQVGIHWSNFTQGKFSYMIVLVMLWFDFALYGLLAFYLEHVLPNQYGVRKPLYFLCTRTYWRGVAERPAQGNAPDPDHVDDDRLSVSLTIGGEDSEEEQLLPVAVHRTASDGALLTRNPGDQSGGQAQPDGDSEEHQFSIFDGLGSRSKALTINDDAQGAGSGVRAPVVSSAVITQAREVAPGTYVMS